MLAAAVLAAVYLIWSPPSADLAAQTFRADLFSQHGFLIFDNLWYSGHYLPGYSVIYPPLGALLGPRLVGALAAVAAAGLFASVARRAYGDRARLAIWWFGAATATNLLTGRITFALGLAVGMGGIWALQRHRPVAAALLGTATALTSPVAALFLSLAAAIGATGQRRRAAAVLGGCALGVTVLLSLAFPTDGWFPFATTAFLPVPLLAFAVLLLAPRHETWLRRGMVVYLVIAVGFACFHTPVGANAARLGALFGGPLLALALAERRPRILGLVAVPLLYWQWVAPIRDLSDALGDPSIHSSYFAPLIDELDLKATGPIRVEVPPTRDRWESAYLAPRYPLARGWLRQLESGDFHLFTDGRLTAASYRAWLDEHAISFVALPDVSFDYLAEDEAALIKGGLSYLQPVWADDDWSLFSVRDATAMVSPAGARLTRVGPADFTLNASRRGDYLVRIHYTPYWSVRSGAACVERDGDWTSVKADAPGTVNISARLSLDGLLRQGGSCSE
jgi:hypothetical protein